MSILRELVRKLDAEQNENMEREADNALAFGIRASALAALTDSKPVILFTRLNPETMEVECSHPDSIPPVFEPATVVLARMAAEVDFRRIGDNETLN